MPDFSYIDQVFDRATPGASVSEEDARAVEQLYIQTNEEEEKKKQQQAAAAGQPAGTRVAGQGQVQQRGGMDMLQGAMKWVEENVGIPLEDTIDNVFQGNQRTPEQVSRDRAGRRESMGQQLQQQKTVQDLPAPARGAVEGLREVGGVIAGGMTGAAESAANTGEILGDTARYFATLGNVKEDQNPFSNRYEWASWDLGKAEAGAQTGAGKVAQGFLEFGALMAATGGFSNLPGAAAKFASAGTALGKAGVVAQAGLYGAAAGIASDMMSATRGEGNLSNLIKDNAPEWYPTWLTALAIDEDDSPWEAMLKTALEGMGIGDAADSLGAYLSGVRAIRAATKAGLPEAQALEAGVQAARQADEAALAGRVANGPQIPEQATRIPEPPQVEPDELLRRMREGDVTSDPEAYDLWRRLPFEVRDEKYKAVESFYRHSDAARSSVQTLEGEAYRQALGEYNNTYGFYGPEDAAKDMGRIQATRPVAEQLADGGSATVEVNLNGHKGTWHLFTGDDKSIVVSWNADTDTGSSVVRMRESFRQIVKELEPGTIVRNDPVSDYSSGRIDTSGPASRRAEFEAQQRRAVSAEQAKAIFNEDYFKKAAAAGTDVADEMERARRLFESPDAETPWDIMSPENQDVWIRDYTRRGRIQGAAQAGGGAADTNIRARIYSHEGFGPLGEGGEQVGVVRGFPGPHGRMVDPIESDLPTDLLQERVARWTREHTLEKAKAADYGNLADYDRSVLSDLRQQFDHLAGTSDDVENGIRAAYDQIDERMRADRWLARQIQQGIPVSWDDIAASEPKYFARGGRAIDSGFSPDLSTFIEKNPDGFSVNPFTLEQPQGGFMVAIDGVQVHRIDPDSLDNFLADNAEVFSREDAFIGGWKDGDEFQLEISRWVPERNEAVYLAKKFDQKAVFDLSSFEEIPTGGKDMLRGTKGQHLASRFGTPGESTVVRPSQAVSQQMAARTDPTVRGGAQRMVTDAQLRNIARAVGDQPTQVLRNLVKNNPIDLDELSHLSRMSADEVVADAAKGIQDALGITGEVDFAKLLRMNVDGEELLSRAGIVQVRGLMQEVTTRLYDSAYSIMKLGDVDMDVFPQVERMVSDLKGLMRVHKVSANTYSHLLSDHKLKVPVLGIEIPNPIKPPSVEELAREIKNADKVLDDLVSKLASGDPKAKQEAWRLANALMLAEGDPSKMPALWRNLLNVTTGQALSVMYNSMLSGPKTHLVNSVSNTINSIYRPLSAFAGGDASVKRAAVAGFYNFHQTLGDAITMSWKTLKDGAIDEGGKAFVMASEVEANIKLLQRAAEMSTDPGFKAATGFMDMIHGIATFPLFSWPSRLLATEDEFFKVITSRMEYNSRSMLEAIDAASGTDQPVAGIFKELLERNHDQAFDAATGAIKDRTLLAAAKDVTFQTDLEGPVRDFATWVNNFPPIRPFFPFVKVGHNITIYAATHVPVLHRYLSEYKAVMAGDDAYAKAVYKGREAFGWMIVLGAATAVQNGLITGNGPMDVNEKRLWMQTHAVRSIKMGNKWIDYSRIEPFGQIVSAVADIHYMFNSGKLSEDRAQYLAGYMAYAIASNFTNKSYMQGVIPLSRLLQPGFTGQEALVRSVAEIGNNFAPLAGARRAFANAMTPYAQEFNSMLDNLLYQASGGLAKNGSPAYDWLTGERIPNGAGGMNALTPLAVNHRGKDRVKDALEDIEFDSSVITKTLTGVKLDRQHRSRMQQLMGESNLRAELDGIVNDPSFRPAVQEYLDRLRAGERVHKENTMFYQRITRTIERYRDMAVEQVKREFPELQAQIIESKLIKNSQRRPTQETAVIDMEHLVNMPIK